jgi:3-hydroxybutyryl-CoA dehydratase
LFFEDFEIGKTFTSPARTVRQADIEKFADLTGDFNRIHLDENYAKHAIFGRRVAHGLLTLSIALGLWYSLDLTNDSILAFMGMKDLSFTGPVYDGDSLILISEVISKKDSKSRTNAGIITFKDKVVKGGGTSVIEFDRTFLLMKKTKEDHSSDS